MDEATFTTGYSTLSHVKRMDILANNLANVNSAGFKEDRLAFEPGVPEGLPEGVEAPSSRLVEKHYTDFSQGQLRFTGSTLDIAIEGKGFFTVQSEAGTFYTRKGNFRLSPEGEISTEEGHRLQGDSGALRVPEGTRAINIDEEGNLYADGARAGTLALADFESTDALRKVGGSLFVLNDPEAAPLRPEGSTLRQGYLEGSNVNAIKAMTEMIDVLRGFEAYQKVLQTIDAADQQVVGEVGRLA